eukprot:TRINITY_DN37287_c0_g1_i2.p1 TRINITY_DN37287_c0_g1~~TRINITY_DN37287_c0_g1_i2.p1  ORF type:complete len:247 (-),score=39.99 TRINITY_DN37287_c0_g1_i2:406-1146(-)
MLDVDAMVRFMKSDMLPLVGEIDEGNMEAYLARAAGANGVGGVLWLCFRGDMYKAHAALHMKIFQQVAWTFPLYPIVYFNTTSFLDHSLQELGCTQYPSAIFQKGNFTDEHAPLRKYTLQWALKTSSVEGELSQVTAANLTTTDVIEWMQSALNGSLQADDPPDFIDEDMELGDLASAITASVSSGPESSQSSAPATEIGPTDASAAVPVAEQASVTAGNLEDQSGPPSIPTSTTTPWVRPPRLEL